MAAPGSEDESEAEDTADELLTAEEAFEMAPSPEEFGRVLRGE